jgi:translation initiation factor IF-3
VPVPRRLDRRPPEQDLTRTNERINAPEVRLIDQDGQQVGVLKTPDALRFAQERDLDLVEVAPQARPPVARVLDYSKYKYEQAQKQKQARKHQQQITVREIKFRPKIAQHDYDTKKGHVTRFLLHKYKVKITIMFRGREVAHPERGVAILDRLAEELSELAVVEQSPTLDGRNMAMLLAPSKAVLSGNVEALGAATANGGATADGAAEPKPAAVAAGGAGSGAESADVAENAPAPVRDESAGASSETSTSERKTPVKAGASAPEAEGTEQAAATATPAADAKPPADKPAKQPSRAAKQPATASKRPKGTGEVKAPTGGDGAREAKPKRKPAAASSRAS